MAFVAAFLQDAKGGDVGHHVIGIAGDPRARAKGFFKLQRIIYDHFAAHGEPKQIAYSPALEGVRVGLGQLAGGLELDHPGGPAAAVIIWILGGRGEGFVRWEGAVLEWYGFQPRGESGFQRIHFLQ